MKVTETTGEEGSREESAGEDVVPPEIVADLEEEKIEAEPEPEVKELKPEIEATGLMQEEELIQQEELIEDRRKFNNYLTSDT